MFYILDSNMNFSHFNLAIELWFPCHPPSSLLFDFSFDIIVIYENIIFSSNLWRQLQTFYITCREKDLKTVSSFKVQASYITFTWLVLFCPLWECQKGYHVWYKPQDIIYYIKIFKIYFYNIKIISYFANVSY